MSPEVRAVMEEIPKPPAPRGYDAGALVGEEGGNGEGEESEGEAAPAAVAAPGGGFAVAQLCGDKVGLAARFTRAQGEAIAWWAQRSGKPLELWLRDLVLGQVPPAVVSEIESGAYSEHSLEALYRDIQDGRVSANAGRAVEAPQGAPQTPEQMRLQQSLQKRRQEAQPILERDRVKQDILQQEEVRRRAQDAIPRVPGHPCLHCKKGEGNDGGGGFGKCGNPVMGGRTCRWPAASAWSCSGYKHGAPTPAQPPR